VELPTDWDSSKNVDLKIVWQSNSTSTNAVVWTVATSCVALDEDTLAPTFNTAQTVQDANLPTANRKNEAALTGVTVTGCAAGETIYFRIGRDPTNGSDNFAATANLVGVEITAHRAP
jgi:hypothetical protein